MDAATAALKRPSVARIQVEVDVLKSLPNRIWIGWGETEGFWQPVEVEFMPSYCPYCWHIGHTEIECHVKSPELKTKVPDQRNIENHSLKKRAEGLRQVYRAKTSDSEKFVGIQHQQRVEIRKRGSDSNTESVLVEQNIEKILKGQEMDLGENKEENPAVVEQIREEKCSGDKTAEQTVEEESAEVEITGTGRVLGEIIPDSTKSDAGMEDEGASGALVLHQETDQSEQDSEQNPKTDVEWPENTKVVSLSEEDVEILVQEGIIEAATEMIEKIADRVMAESESEEEDLENQSELALVIQHGNLSPRSGKQNGRKGTKSRKIIHTRRGIYH